ncbi:MAG TPA: PAS domain-containing protein [Rhizomicrobium sp.]|jgi:hypothetical protein
MGHREAIAASYNARAAREGWPTICDAGLSFLRPELKGLLEIWRAEAGIGGIPRRRAISHRSLRGLLARIAIYERSGGLELDARYRVRLIGSEFAEIMGDLTGKYLDEAIPAAYLPRWHTALDASLIAAAPLRFLTRSDTAGKNFLIAEYFEAPLLSECGEMTIILGAAYYSTDKRWSEQLTIESEAQTPPH